ncbi:hypothetical protein DFH28DRAFT_927482 [Melampsora americana]|nr:hypothetical protein DFH28DRAFT_927482 [Melampsora americana]
MEGVEAQILELSVATVPPASVESAQITNGSLTSQSLRNKAKEAFTMQSGVTTTQQSFQDVKPLEIGGFDDSQTDNAKTDAIEAPARPSALLPVVETNSIETAKRLRIQCKRPASPSAGNSPSKSLALPPPQVAVSTKTKQRAKAALIGKEQGFPRAPDPVSILRNDFNIKIIQMPDSKLPSAVLKLGFNKMNSRRSLWLEDVKAKMFKMEKINTNPTGKEEIQGDDSGGEDEVTMTQDDRQYQGVDEMEVKFDDELEDLEQEEEKEWNGLGYMENSD